MTDDKQPNEENKAPLDTIQKQGIYIAETQYIVQIKKIL